VALRSSLAVGEHAVLPRGPPPARVAHDLVLLPFLRRASLAPVYWHTPPSAPMPRSNRSVGGAAARACSSRERSRRHAHWTTCGLSRAIGLTHGQRDPVSSTFVGMKFPSNNRAQSAASEAIMQKGFPRPRGVFT